MLHSAKWLVCAIGTDRCVVLWVFGSVCRCISRMTIMDDGGHSDVEWLVIRFLSEILFGVTVNWLIAMTNDKRRECAMLTMKRQHRVIILVELSRWRGQCGRRRRTECNSKCSDHLGGYLSSQLEKLASLRAYRRGRRRHVKLKQCSVIDRHSRRLRSYTKTTSVTAKHRQWHDHFML